MKGYRQLNYTDRIKLEGFFGIGMSKWRIAEIMEISLKTVYNEWNLGKYQHLKTDYTYELRYSAELAQEKHDRNVKDRGIMPKILKDRKLARYIEKKICDEDYSPEAVAGELRCTGKADHFKCSVCAKTIYNSIDKGLFARLTNKALPVKRDKKKKKNRIVKRKKKCAGKSIEERADDILEREEFGHFEMDTVIGPRGKHCTLLVLTERKTRNEIIRKCSDKSTKSVVSVLDDLERQMGDSFYKIFKTITVDNGTEFSDAEGMERSCVYPGKKRTQVYYCHPYSSWERGSNENQNKLIRRKVPKGMNFDDMTDEEVQRIEDWINSYPRRIFKFRNSKDLYKEEMRYLI